MNARQRAREAQTRLAYMREEDRASVPKIALSVMAALHVLATRQDSVVSIGDVCDFTGEPEREAHRGIGWLRDNRIIERTRTNGGSGHAAPTRFMSDEEVREAERRSQAEFDAWRQNGGGQYHP